MIRAVADYMDGDGPLPRPLRHWFRMETLGAPWAGGYMQWPAAWLRDVEAAGNTYNTLNAFRKATGNLEGDALAKWQSENARLVKAALAIERMRDGDDGE